MDCVVKFSRHRGATSFDISLIMYCTVLVSIPYMAFSEVWLLREDVSVKVVYCCEEL